MSYQTTVVFTFDEGGKRKKYRFQVSADSFKEIKQKHRSYTQNFKRLYMVPKEVKNTLSSMKVNE